MDATIDAVAEIFSWVGFGLGALVAGVALVMYLFDGTWLPTRGVLDDGEHGRVVRWFDEDGNVNEAHLTHEQEQVMNRFGKELGLWLQQQIGAHKIDNVHMFAEPRLIGELRKVFPKTLNGCVIEHESELAPLKNDELLKHPTVQKIMGNGVAH